MRKFCLLVILLSAVGGQAIAGTNDSSVASRRADINKISKRIDELVQANLTAHHQQPNVLCDDETFLRRIYLDVVGRIPDYNEASRFLKSKRKNKRAELIDELLGSAGYDSHQFNHWADILRVKSRLNGGNPGMPYIDFLKQSIEDNMPFDQFVRELLTAEGAALERGNGSVGYYLRDQGMPEDNMANTVRVFLGTRLECAQCHDHPFDTWTQREFFEMVAFRGGVTTRMPPGGGAIGSGQAMRKQIRKADADENVKQLATNLIRPLTYGVYGGGTGLARLPESCQYDDGEPDEVVTAKAIFDAEPLVHPTVPVSSTKRKTRRRPGQRGAVEVPGAKDIGSREAFANWLTSPDNPRFTLVIVNRMWKRAMGLGLIEPVDDLNDASEASNPALLEFLTEQFVDLDYDTKQFYRAIFNSKTYQRDASDVDVEDPATYHFPGPLLRRLSAEQLWDSFLTLAVPDLDTRENPRQRIGRNMLGRDPYESFEKAKNLSVDELLSEAEKLLELRNDPKKRRQMYQQTMMSSNSDTKYADEAKAIRQRVNALKKLRQRAQKQKRPQVVRRIQAEMRELGEQLRHIPTRVSPDLVRASELQSPAPAGHFLREFGQSDRDQIENSNQEPAVSQVLSLMNGQIEKRIVSNPRTVLMRNVSQADSIHDKIDVIFLSLLSRFPEREEKAMWLKLGRETGADAANDLIWTLANTSEFMFIH